MPLIKWTHLEVGKYWRRIFSKILQLSMKCQIILAVLSLKSDHMEDCTYLQPKQDPKY